MYVLSSLICCSIEPQVVSMVLRRRDVQEWIDLASLSIVTKMVFAGVLVDSRQMPATRKAKGIHCDVTRSQTRLSRDDCVAERDMSTPLVLPLPSLQTDGRSRISRSTLQSLLLKTRVMAHRLSVDTHRNVPPESNSVPSSLVGDSDGFYPTERGYLSADGRNVYLPADEEWTYFPYSPGFEEVVAGNMEDVPGGGLHPPLPMQVSTYSTLHTAVQPSPMSQQCPARYPVADVDVDMMDPLLEAAVPASVVPGAGCNVLHHATCSHHAENCDQHSERGGSDGSHSCRDLKSRQSRLGEEGGSRPSLRKGYFDALSDNVGFKTTDP